MQNDLPQIDNSSPNSDELEVSLFGPGVGECIVAHLGDNQWMVIDSCKNPKTKNPAALDYLKEIGVKLDAVSVIVISHWHTDHIRGAADLVAACPNAQVVYSAALLKEEFLTLVDAYSISASVVGCESAGLSEMRSIVQCLDDRNEDDEGYAKANMKPALADTIIHNYKCDEFHTQVWALSPSSTSFNEALQEFESLIPSEGDQRKVISCPSENINSVAIWIEMGEYSVLLGADLEETKNPNTGWSVIVDSKVRPKEQANIFKIPHHGSSTGHSQDVWEQMTCDNTIALCTTFNNSHLPKAEDVERIKEYTENLYCTTISKSKLPKRESSVERTLKEVTKTRRVIGGAVGQLQVRIKQDGTCRVCAKPPALQL